jgi:2-keto-4-pentenoate hydratase/2-oxohepta-3-ene-1,7-dioic acid hydratase in catechol pathway
VYLVRVLDPACGAVWATREGRDLYLVDDVFGACTVGARLDPSASELVCVAPSKIVCIGRNYAEHARELGNEVPAEPTLFLKPPSSLIGQGVEIVRPRAHSELIHHEGELGVVVGRRLSNATLAEAAEAIWGFVPANDVTARDLQRTDRTWARAKGFDTFCPVGPAVRLASAAPPIEDLRVRVEVDGEVRQDGACSDMIFPVASCLAYASRVFTLEPGDLVLTGTPEGVGPLHDGETVCVEIEGVGRLENPVVDGASAEDLPDWM